MPQQSLAPTTESPAVGPDGRLEMDVPCVRCGYNLRGLHAKSICPECGTPIGRSLRGDLLAFSDPDWVSQLSRAANWVMASILVSLTLGVLSAAISGTSGSLALLVQLLIDVLAFVAYWLLTTPEPRRFYAESPTSPRIITRVAAVAGLLTSLAEMASPGLPGSVAGLLLLVTTVVGVVQMAASYVYLRQLALRIPNDHLARRTRIVLIGSLVTMGPMMLLTMLSQLTGSVLLAAPVCVLLPGMIVFAIWGFILILRYRKAFRDAAATARASWAAEPPVLPAGS